ncbi:MAG: hypothetical protein ACREIK_05235 [Nitrospiraceae bacterium]
MPDPIVTDPILTEFVQRLKQRAEIAEFSLTPWVKPGRTREWTAHLAGSVNALLHVLAATGTQGHWQVPKDIVEDFAGSGRKWAIVLLVRTSQTGYLLPGQEVRRRTESGEWSLHGGTYGVAEGPTLHSEYYFKEFDTLVFRLLTPGMI